MESSKICRLCLQNNSDYIDLFSETGKEQEITKIISKHFWFKPTENDNYSNLICLTCWDCLSAFHKFYNEIRNAQENLLKRQSFLNVDDHQEDYLESEGQIPENVLIIKEEIKEESTFYSNENEFYDGNDANEDEGPVVDDEIKNEISSNPNFNSEDSKSCDTKHKRKKTLAKESIIKRKRGRPLKSDSVQPKPSKSLAEIEEEQREKCKRRNKRDGDDQRIREFFKLECQLCPSKMNTFIEVKAHYRQAHGIRRGYITCCKKKFIRRCDILRHITWHLNPNEFRCSVCSKVYNDQNGLRMHMVYHAPAEDRIFKCDICDRGYTTKGKLAQHLRVSHVSEDAKKYKCKECGIAFALPSFLQGHIRRVHESYYATICDICAKVFKSKAQCVIHRAAQHSDEKPQKMQCSLCGVWLKTRKSLNSHMRRTHNNVPEPCKICGKIFSNKESLRNHIRYMHELERLHKCHYCDKAFKQNLELKEHMASHTGDVLYVCPYCPKTFNSNANMHSHRKHKHPVEWERDRNIRMGLT